MTEAQRYLVRDFNVVIEDEALSIKTRFAVQCRRPHDSDEWELRTIRVEGKFTNYDSTDISDLLANFANELFCKIEDDALAQCTKYDKDAPVEAVLDAMKE